MWRASSLSAWKTGERAGRGGGPEVMGDSPRPSGRGGGRQCPTRPRGVGKGPEPALAEEEQWGRGGCTGAGAQVWGEGKRALHGGGAAAGSKGQASPNLEAPLNTAFPGGRALGGEKDNYNFDNS